MEVEVCDICKKNLADHRCNLCGASICLNCGRSAKWGRSEDYFALISKNYLIRERNEDLPNLIKICNNCEDEFEKSVKEFTNMPLSTKKLLVEEIINLMKERMNELIVANKI